MKINKIGETKMKHIFIAIFSVFAYGCSSAGAIPKKHDTTEKLIKCVKIPPDTKRQEKK